MKNIYVVIRSLLQGFSSSFPKLCLTAFHRQTPTYFNLSIREPEIQNWFYADILSVPFDSACPYPLCTNYSAGPNLPAIKII